MAYSQSTPSPTRAPSAPIFSTLFWGITGLLSLGPLMMSAMLFDAPGSEHDRALWFVVASLASFPLACAFSVVGGWFAHGMNAGVRARRALAWLPLASVALFAAAILVWSRR